MKDEEVRKIHVNNTVRDSEIAEAEDLLRDVDPGSYRVKDGAVVRFGGEPLTNPRTLNLFAKSLSVIPRLITGIRTLEDALRRAWDDASGSRRELIAEREGRREDADRRSAGKTGPDWELSLVARYLVASAQCPNTFGGDRTNPVYVEQLVRRWAGGESIAGGSLRGIVESLEARAKEHAETTARHAAEREVEVAALKARLLEANEEVARGQIREELKKPLRDAKKRIKAAEVKA